MSAKPLRVGVTGGIGCGKSVVCRMFALLGVPVYDSDREAKRLMNGDEELKAALVARFGTVCYVGEVLDRRYLAGVVFGDGGALADLNGLVHPVVRRDFCRWADRQQTPYVLAESAVLFESGLDRDVDRIVAVSAPEELRVRRAALRDGAAPELIRQRVRAQMEDAERERRAHAVICNDEEQLVWPQVLALDERFRREAGAAQR